MSNQKGKNWILKHPTEFCQNAIAGCTDAQSTFFLTRHLRAGYWRGLPQWADEILILGMSFEFVYFTGWDIFDVVSCQRKTRYFIGRICSPCCRYSALAGLTRYRVPLEPILMIYAEDGLGYFAMSKAKHAQVPQMTRMEKSK